jgi:hypothetical protein
MFPNDNIAVIIHMYVKKLNWLASKNSKLARTSSALKIHISSETKMLLETVGGGDFAVKKRGTVEFKSKGPVETFWLVPVDNDHHKITRCQFNNFFLW